MGTFQAKQLFHLSVFLRFFIRFEFCWKDFFPVRGFIFPFRVDPILEGLCFQSEIKHGLLYLTCTMISSVDLAHYRVPRAKYWVTEDCSTRK